MSKRTILQLTLLVVFAAALSGCSLREKLQNKINSTQTPTSDSATTSNAQTAETYDSVQKVRAAASEKEAVSVTTSEVDAAFKEADSVGTVEALNTTDVGL
mgnify:CR=1 FL=1